MELFQLRYFIKAAELRSFTRAAEACSVSQPALSQSIQKLEDELRQPLFERGGRQISLSDAGQRFLTRAREVIRLADEARATMTDDGETGTLRITAIPTVAPYLLPTLARQFAQRQPLVQLELSEDVTEQALKRCRSGEVDVVILALPRSESDFDFTLLCTETLLAVLPVEHPLQSVTQIDIAALENEPFVLLDEVHCLTGDINSFCKRNRIQPRIASRSHQLTTVLELVANGFGISLIPEMAMARHVDPRLIYRRLAGAQPTRQIGLCTNPYRFRSKVQKSFEQLVIESCAKTPAVGH